MPPLYRLTFIQMARRGAYEQSELMLYRYLMLEEQGEIAAALNHLDNSRGQIVDKHAFSTKRAELLLYLKRFGEAEDSFRELLRSDR